jgi:2-keto-4-pentenoate hydratase/2-oxohepta-3-ene-1,7-dioic acid hydratase in catechol pathway
MDSGRFQCGNSAASEVKAPAQSHLLELYAPPFCNRIAAAFNSWSAILKLLRCGEKGRERPAMLGPEGQRLDLSSLIRDIGAELLSSNFSGLRDQDFSTLPEIGPQERIGPPIAQVGKFICIGLNYGEHAKESGMEIPKEPVIFTKATSAIIGPNDDVLIPRGSRKTDWEVELGVVIGSEARYVSEKDALSHVAGLLVVNDLSEREFQLERGGTWDKGKGCDTFGPIGPWLVTLDEVESLDALELWLDVNGQRRQTGSTSDLIFNIPHIVHYVSQFMSLQPGDIISTGTPPGVGLGMKPPTYLKPGDTMELGISGLGSQRQQVKATP